MVMCAAALISPTPLFIGKAIWEQRHSRIYGKTGSRNTGQDRWSKKTRDVLHAIISLIVSAAAGWWEKEICTAFLMCYDWTHYGIDVIIFRAFKSNLSPKQPFLPSGHHSLFPFRPAPLDYIHPVDNRLDRCHDNIVVKPSSSIFLLISVYKHKRHVCKRIRPPVIALSWYSLSLISGPIIFLIAFVAASTGPTLQRSRFLTLRADLSWPRRQSHLVSGRHLHFFKNSIRLRLLRLAQDIISDRCYVVL